MLRDLLRLVLARGACRQDEAARALGLTPELVRAAMGELVRRDCLRPVPLQCARACEQCPLRSACARGRQPILWSLTPKGEAWARKGAPDPA